MGVPFKKMNLTSFDLQGHGQGHGQGHHRIAREKSEIPSTLYLYKHFNCSRYPLVPGLLDQPVNVDIRKKYTLL